MKKAFFITLGLLATTLGAIGVVVPGLPTTPFILLASWCFYRSSKRLQDWLHRSFLGKYIRNYKKQGGLSRKGKTMAITMMVVMCTISTIFFIPKGSVAKIIVPIAGLVGSVVVAFVVPGVKKEEAAPQE